MARFTPPPSPFSTTTALSKRLTFTVLEPLISLWILCVKRASKATKKVAANTSPKPSFAKPREFLATMSHKAINNFRSKKNTKKASSGGGHGGDDFGDGGLWQRSILMGDKCQPLDFSGVIYYDSNGKRLSELPVRSPRASPMPNYVCSKKEE